MVLPGPLRHCFFCGRFLAFFETEAVLRTLLTMPRAGAARGWLQGSSAPPTANCTSSSPDSSSHYEIYASNRGSVLRDNIVL
jgi:hypothetical protein